MMIYRIDVQSGSPDSGIRQQILEMGIAVGPVRVSHIFLIDSSATRQQMALAALELLADPVAEQAVLVDGSEQDNGVSRIEVHLKPGVMDPVAESTEMALRDMQIPLAEVRTGRAYVIEGIVPKSDLQRIAARVLANGVIESVHFDRFVPSSFPKGHEQGFTVRHVELRKLSDEQLTQLSRSAHLFLSLAEMKAIQSYYQQQGREPTDVELETLAQTWSEHCVHKTLKSAVDVEVQDESGKAVGRRQYKNLIKETIFGSTQDLMHRAKERFCLSVFADNAGVIVFDDADAVCFKVETHNHPSAIEPYGGSATGVGGVIRDILGTGLAAKPIANTDVFCVAFPDRDATSLPRGVIHPKRILQQVVAGVRDYGNRMGIPTVNGAVYFDDRYVGNPLVFCGCVGLIPRDKIFKEVQEGDAIVVIGGRTGRDGIHGATFSSAELTDTHADEFSHAVQIGNAITEKKVADVILQARDRSLFTAVTDCGAGGLSSAVGEMGQTLGAFVELEKVPLKYAGLRHDEIWISEAQERMVVSVPAARLDELLTLSAGENVEATVIGHFGTPTRELILNYRGKEVGRLSVEFLHDGIPMPTRKAVVVEQTTSAQRQLTSAPVADYKSHLLKLLAHPNIASKHWIIRQYDHEVQGGSIIKPLTGPLQMGPSDATVVRPKLGTARAVALGCGIAPQIEDPYRMALAAIDEAIRNIIAVGANPNRIAILDNFCWPSVDDARTMGTLVRACEACRDAALAYGIPFISGKDSLHNQFTNSETGQVIRIPSTLLISAIAIVDDTRKCVTMDLKAAGNKLCLISPENPDSLENLRQVHHVVAGLIQGGQVRSCHDVSDGGILTAAAEMCMASGLGVELNTNAQWFDEQSGRYLLEIEADAEASVRMACQNHAATLTALGLVSKTPKLGLAGVAGTKSVEIAIADLQKAWRGTLDW